MPLPAGIVETCVDLGLRAPGGGRLEISAETGIRKPDVRAFEFVSAAWGARPDQVVMVGDDSEADVAGARAAGMRTIWFRNGRHNGAHADFVISSWVDLPWIAETME